MQDTDGFWGFQAEIGIWISQIPVFPPFHEKCYFELETRAWCFLAEDVPLDVALVFYPSPPTLVAAGELGCTPGSADPACVVLGYITSYLSPVTICAWMLC